MWNGIKILFVALCLGGCASVDVQYVKPGDTTTHGFRYYLPRPYVAVKKSFPVEYHEEYLPGRVKGERIQVNLAKASSSIRSLNTTGSDVWYIDFSKVTVSDSVQVDGKTFTTNAASGDGEKGNDGDGDMDKTKKDDESKPETTAATSGPSAVPINEFFDVLYLPDFKQQYAVDFESGLGSAKQSLKLQHGWMLTDYSGETDNSEVLNSIGSFIGSAVSSLAGFAAIGAQPGGEEQDPAEGESEDNVNEALSLSAPEISIAEEDKVLIKVMVARNALPGTYPVLKPDEITQYKSLSANSEQRLVPNPEEVENAPFAILYTTELMARFELVSVTKIPLPN